MRLIFDIETNGLLPTLTTLHSLVLRDADSGDLVFSYAAGTAEGGEDRQALRLLAEAEEIIGHNVINFDIPAIQKLYPDWSPRGRVTDTIVCARLWKTGDVLRGEDFDLAKKGKLEVKYAGSQSLEAWGKRLGVLKGDFGKETHSTKEGDPWARWTPEMQEYCEQDTLVTLRLWRELQAANLSPQAVEIEHAFAWIIARQERRGFSFDEATAAALHAKLVAERSKVADDLRRTFKPWWRGVGEMVPKRDNKKMGYAAGCAFTKVELHEFEPSSRQDFADRLIRLRGWKPKEFTGDGRPKVDEQVLGLLPYPEAKLLARYLMLEKRIGQIATGNEAWLRHVRAGRIHGAVNTGGAHTGRCTHSRPNMAQVPSGRAPFGHECRSLFRAGTGYALVGFDADALELRCLAHFLARHDGGAFGRAVSEGKKEEGTDPHTLNAVALGLDPKRKYPIDGKEMSGRDIAKVWFYAFIYGAGNVKLGEILGVRGTETKMGAAGKAARTRFLRALPALAKLVEEVQATVAKRGYILGLDKRVLRCRTANAALNTLLQSAGAVVMKQALVRLDASLVGDGWVPGEDYEYVANVHDEAQAEVRPERAEEFGRRAVQGIVQTGVDFGFRCPLAGAYAVGQTWADTH